MKTIHSQSIPQQYLFAAMQLKLGKFFPNHIVKCGTKADTLYSGEGKEDTMNVFVRKYNGRHRRTVWLGTFHFMQPVDKQWYANDLECMTMEDMLFVVNLRMEINNALKQTVAFDFNSLVK